MTPAMLPVWLGRIRRQWQRFVVVVDLVERHDHARQHIQDVSADPLVVPRTENERGGRRGVIVTMPNLRDELIASTGRFTALA